MKKILWTYASIVLFASMVCSPAFAGGRPKPMEEIINAPLVWPAGKTPELGVVQTAILRACLDKGWACTVTSPGLVHAVLAKKAYNAELDIPFSTIDYSITYSSSVNLDYDPVKKVIHRNWNKWLVYLRQRIDANMMAAGL